MKSFMMESILTIVNSSKIGEKAKIKAIFDIISKFDANKNDDFNKNDNQDIKNANEAIAKAKENSYKYIKILIQKFKNTKDNEGKTLLFYALSKNNIWLVKELISAKAELNIQNQDGDTPLHIAVFKRDIEIISELIKGGADLNIQNENGNTPFHIAVFNENLEIALKLIKGGAKLEGTPGSCVNKNDILRTLEAIKLKYPSEDLSSLSKDIKKELDHNLKAYNQFAFEIYKSFRDKPDLEPKKRSEELEKPLNKFAATLDPKNTGDLEGLKELLENKKFTKSLNNQIKNDKFSENKIINWIANFIKKMIEKLVTPQMDSEMKWKIHSENISLATKAPSQFDNSKTKGPEK